MEAQALLSRICDTNDVNAIKRYGITADHFASASERQALRYIQDYAEQNGGKAPDGAWLDAEVGEGFYLPNEMELGYLAKRIKDDAFFRKAQTLFDDNQLQAAFDAGNRERFEKLLTSTLQDITMETSVRGTAGRTLADLKTDYYDEYLDRKAGRSHRLWATPFPTLNDAIGGLYSSDVYGVMAESGRGKSYLLIAVVDELLRQGANVLVKSYELKAYSWLSRLLSVISARDGAFTDSRGQSVGLANNRLLSGRLDAEAESYFAELLDNLNDYYEGELHLQAKGDADLKRSLDDLDGELSSRPEIDAVVLDPFYGLSDTYGKNANKTKGGAAEQAARRFEWLVGEHDVVGLFAVQAQTEKQTVEDDEVRPLKLPTRDQVKTSKALLEICTNLFAFDNNGDGESLVGIDKGRSGGEGFELSLLALLDVGVLREFPSGSDLPF